jgi:hypothetical protein
VSLPQQRLQAMAGLAALANVEAPPPRRCTSKADHPDFHPSCARIGVTVDGVDRSDVIQYDLHSRTYRTLDTGMKGEAILAQTIEVRWKWPESRQQRRARERWESAHGAPQDR